MSATKKFFLIFGCCVGICLLSWVILVGAVYAWGGVLTVKVDNPQGPDVAIPVPMAIVDAAIATGDLAFDDVRVQLGEYGPMIEEILEVIEDCPDAVFVEVEDRGDYVRVAKENGYLRVEVRERGSHGVDVRVSLPVRSATRSLSRLVS